MERLSTVLRVALHAGGAASLTQRAREPEPHGVDARHADHRHGRRVGKANLGHPRRAVHVRPARGTPAHAEGVGIGGFEGATALQTQIAGYVLFAAATWIAEPMQDLAVRHRARNWPVRLIGQERVLIHGVTLRVDTNSAPRATKQQTEQRVIITAPATIAAFGRIKHFISVAVAAIAVNVNGGLGIECGGISIDIC